MPRKSARSKGWKDVQSKKRTAKLVKLSLIILAILFLVLVLSQAVKFTRMLFSPWKASGSVKNYTWNGDFNINIVMLGKDISFLSFDPASEELTVLDIPPNTYLQLSNGFGMWQVRSIYDLGESQNMGGGKLLRSSLQNLFGMPSDGFLQFSGKFSSKSSDVLLSELRKNPFNLAATLPFIKTDLTPFELVRLNMGVAGVRFDKIEQIKLGSTPALKKDKLADGTDVFIPDEARLDGILSDMADPKIVEEHKTIAIFNSTIHPGLAQKAARLISNIGGNVIITSNSERKLQYTEVTGEKSKTLERLQQIFGSSGTIVPESEEQVLSRAQINIFLGEDYFDQ